MKTFLVVIQIILAIMIIVSILMQPSKADGFNNFVSSKTDTFYSRNKVRTSETVLNKITIASSTFFALVTIAINLIK